MPEGYLVSDLRKTRLDLDLQSWQNHLEVLLVLRAWLAD